MEQTNLSYHRRTSTARSCKSEKFSSARVAKTKKDDLAKPEAVEKVRSEARQRLMQEIPSENVRVLAYRLSLISGSFSREMATSLAAAPLH